MKLNVDFSDLFRAVAPLEYVVTEFVLDGGEFKERQFADESKLHDVKPYQVLRL